MTRRLRRVLVTGATSAMVRSTLEAFADDGARIALGARDAAAAEALAGALVARGSEAAVVLPFDAEEPAAGAGVVDAARDALGGLDAVLVAQGSLTDQTAFERDPAARERSLRVNGLTAVETLMRAAELLERQGHGALAGISSGAGERARRATYGYGMGKALVTQCLGGLRARLHRRGVSVTCVFPCFVDTPMTARLPRALRHVDAARAGRRIHAGMVRGADFVHIPRWWRLALLAARLAPEAWLKRSRAEERYAAKLPDPDDR